MNAKPLISVVMPCYNAECYIEESIKSILNQTFKDFELIIVDDGSTDRSLEIIKKYARKDKRIRVIRNKKNMGIAISRNIGTKAAKGKYIAVHDSDDISLPFRLKEQFDYLEKNPEAGVVGGYLQIFESESEKVIGIRKYPENDENLRNKIFFYSPVAQPAAMIRKDVFKKIGFYNPKYPPSEDLDFWFRLGEQYKFANLPKVVLKYRISQNSATGSKLKLMEKLTSEIRWKNHNNPHYQFGILEFTYNFLHFISLFIVPSKIKSWMFTKLRDKK